MRNVYSSENALEAHMLVHLLEQEGIQAFVQGEELQAGLGGLPLNDYIKIAVAESDYERARTFVIEWDKKNNAQPKAAGILAHNNTPSNTFALLLCLIIGLALGYLIGVVHKQETKDNNHSLVENIDQNNDGKSDAIFYYTKESDSYASSSEQDLNFDGIFDVNTEYDENGNITSDQSDSDFDGRKETTSIYKNGILSKSMVDADGDGNYDVINIYNNNTLLHTYFFQEKSDIPVKKNVYKIYMLTSSDFDSDSDGVYDTRYTYDRFEQIIKTEKINISAADFSK